MSSYPPHPAWRRPDEAPPPPPPGWRGGPPPPGRGRRLALVGAAGAGLLALGSVAVWVILWLRVPPPARLLAVGSGYTENFAAAPFPHGAIGVARLSAGRPGAPPGPYGLTVGRLRPLGPPRELLAADAWDAPLDDASRSTLVAVFALHGGADADGPYLLTADAGRVRVSAILDRLGKLPARRPKVLIFDASAGAAGPGLGLIHNDFARSLAAMGDRVAAVPNLVVLASAGPGQRSWGGEYLGGTAFLAALSSGLAGAADANADGRVNALEAHRFAARAAEDYARVQWGARQTPLLLPAGPEGERRAAAAHLAMAGDAAPAPKPPADAAPAWAALRRLADARPASVAPHLWREAEECALRAESFARAGDADAADRLTKRIGSIAEQVARIGRLDAPSAATSAALPDALRLPEADGAPLDALAGELWSASPTAAAGALEKGAELLAAPSARPALAARLVARAADDPEAGLPRAARLTELLTRPLPAPPAEAHFAAALARDWPRPTADATTPERAARAALAARGLRLRLTAERAALGADTPHAPDARRWMRRLADAADASRRLGDDLLLATDPADVARGAGHYAAAEADYADCRTVAALVSDAVETRDRAISRLPHLGRWFARLPGGDGLAARREDAARLDALAAAWGAAHHLAAALAAPPPDKAARPADAELAALSQRRAAASEKLAAAEGEFGRRWRAALDERRAGASGRPDPAADVRFRHEAEAALLVPWLDVGDRAALLGESRRAADRLAAAPGAVVADSAERTEELAVEAARRAGRLTLAALGPAGFDAMPRGERRLSPAEITFELERFPGEAGGWLALGRAGDELGRALRAAGAEAARLSAGVRARDPEEPDALKHDEEDLARADLLSRIADPSDAARLGDGPADALRRLRARFLLVDQANRALGDYFAALSPGEPAYFRAAGELLLADARAVRGRAGPGRDADALERSLREPDPFPAAVESPDSLRLSTDPSAELRYRLGAGARPGVPVYWLAPSALLEPVSAASAGRLARPLGSASEATFALRSQRLEASAGASAPAPERGSALLHGRFRGRILRVETPVELFPVAETVFRRGPAEPRAGLAVRAAPEVQTRFGLTTGQLVIVLDCSGSMGPPAGAEPGAAAPKFDAVTEALAEVLAGLPRGATVSLWAFGQAVGEARVAESAESTITRLLPPTPWEPGRLGPLMEQVRGLTPWNESPVVRAMADARADFAAGAPGASKTMVVLTDGVDNRFSKDAKLNPGGTKSVSDGIRDAFGGGEVAVHVVGFRLSDAEEAQASEQFRVVAQLPRRGAVHLARETPELVRALRAALRQRVRYELRSDGVLVANAVQEMGGDGAGDAWVDGGLPPGGYRVAAETERKNVQPLELGAGDRLVVRLGGPSGGRRFERVLWTERAGRPYWTQGDWRLVGLQNQIFPGVASAKVPSRLRVLFGMENAANLTGPTLAAPRPRELWLELGGQPEPFTLRWGAEPGYALPAWGLDVPSWPPAEGPAPPPTLRAWWDPADPAPVAASASAAPGAPLLGRLGLDLGGGVVVESVRLERATVEAPGSPRAARECLAVRLRVPPGVELLARPLGLNLPYEEHRLYRKADRYLGLFWRDRPALTDAEAAEGLGRIEVLSVTAFKARSASRGFFKELADFGAPRPDDAPPEAVPLRGGR